MNEITNLTKEQIFGNDRLEIFNYIDTKYMDLETKYNVTYIRIDEEFRNNPLYLPNKTNAFPSLEGYKLISDKIIKKLES